MAQQPRTTTSVKPKDWVTKEYQQNRIIDFLLWAYGGLLAATIAIFFLQGFQFHGFFLDASILKWLAGMTVGEVAGLLTITLREVFKK